MTMRMAAPLLAALLLLSHSHAFSPSIHYHKMERRITPSFLCSMATENTSQHQQSNESNTHSLNRQLDQLANRCGDPKEQVAILASQCQDLFDSEQRHVDVISFNTVLKALSKTSATLADKKNRGFGVLQEPTTTTTTTSIQDKSVSNPIYTARDAAERATNLLLEMERAHEQDPDSSIAPDALSYNSVIDAWAKSRVEDAPQACERLLKRMLSHDTIHPDTISYNAVLDAWQGDKSPNSLERIDKIYRHMQQEYEQGNVSVKPTIRTVNSVITAHAKHIYQLQGKEALECAKAAHAILDENKEKYAETGDADYQVDVVTYTSVMEAYARCGSLNATMAAEQLLKELTDLYQETNNSKLQPNTRTYTALITAWAKTKSYKAPHNAEALLKEMEESEDTSIKPNTRSYTAVIQAWARSRDATKPQRALRILKHMKELARNGDTHARPNLITYNSAIDACARCQGTTKQQTEALKIAFAILKSIQLEQDMEANHVTFATILKATAFLLPAGEERNKVASALFEKARAAGMVDVEMIKNMRKAVDNNVMQELLQNLQDKKGHVNYNNIPPAWSRNVR